MFRAYLIFEFFFVLGFSKNVSAAYENNPFFQGENQPSTVRTTNLPTTTNTVPTREPVFTIEPPEILYGHNLNRKCLKPRGQFPSDTCKKYVNCWDGVAIEESCSGHFLFNPVKLYCDYPENVDCHGKPITLKATPTPTANDYIPTTPALLRPTEEVTPNSIQLSADITLRKFCLRSTGLFPGSTCSKFVNCWDNQAIEQDCPPGLYFSSEGYCDYADKVHCDGNHNNDGRAPTKLDAEYDDCPLEFGNFRNRSDCGRYYTCAFHRVVARYNCPNGFSFSDILGICDYSYRVDCSKQPQFFDIRGIETQDSDCPLEFGNFRNKTTCTQYYTCAFHKVAAKYHCPEGLSFSDILGLCDYSYMVNCTKEPQIINQNINTLQASEDSLCTVKNGLVRNPENCSSYHVCEFGKVVSTYVCPTELKFSNELGICDQERNVKCNDDSKAFEIGSDNMVVPNISKEVLSQVQKCVPGSVFRLDPQCTKACRCRNGIAEIIQCSAGLAYDSETDKCVLAHLARC